MKNEDKDYNYVETHAGELLSEEFIKPTGLSHNAIARLIGVPGSRIHEIVKGERSISVDTDLRLCKFFGVRDGYFLRAQEHFEIIKTKRELKLELDKIQQFQFHNDGQNSLTSKNY
jgi:addiction module HigA family antidote